MAVAESAENNTGGEILRPPSMKTVEPQTIEGEKRTDAVGKEEANISDPIDTQKTESEPHVEENVTGQDQSAAIKIENHNALTSQSRISEPVNFLLLFLKLYDFLICTENI